MKLKHGLWDMTQPVMGSFYMSANAMMDFVIFVVKLSHQGG